MKKVTIFTRKKELYSCDRFVEEFAKQNIEVDLIDPFQVTMETGASGCTFHYDGNSFLPSFVVHRVTGVHGDNYDLQVLKGLESHGSQILNPLNLLIKCRDKLTQVRLMAQAQVPHIPTFSFRGEFTSSKFEIMNKHFLNAGVASNDRYVCKVLRGNQGCGVSIINGKESLISLMDTFHALKDQEFLLSPYVDNKQEYRAVLVGSNIVGVVEKKLNKDTNKGNFKKGSSRRVIDLGLDLKMKSLIGDVIELFGLDGETYCAIDFFKTDEGLFVLEVNSVPGFQQFEEISDINYAEKIIQSISLTD